LKKALQMNAIANCPVTINDVTRAEDIFGPDIASLMGKTTRHKPLPYVEEVVDIPPELISAQQQVHLCIDMFYVNEIPFLTTISRHIKYRTCSLIPERKVTSYLTALYKVFKTYRSAGFRIHCIYADNEFGPMLDTLTSNDPNIKYELTSAQAHQSCQVLCCR
jgi:hypothetical protein